MILKNLFFLFFLFPIFSLFAEDPKFTVADGFTISIFAENLDMPRQMAEGEYGTIFVAQRNGNILALTDSDNNGQIDARKIVAKDLTYSTGVSIFNGDLYFSEISNIWKIENIEEWLRSNKNSTAIPEKVLITDDLPNDKWHGWKWLKHDDRGRLYLNVGAPCNICLSENPQYASILRIGDNNWEYIAQGVRNSVGFDFHPKTKKLFFY
jgi:glucose/arabinose dehydrogenase